VTILAMLASVAIQPILTVYIAEMTGGSSSAPMISGVLFSLPAIAFVFTATSWVRTGQRVGFTTVLQWGLLGAGLSGVALYFAHTVYWFALFFFAQGIFLAALRPVTSAIISEEVDESFRGRAFGLQQSALTFGGLIGPMIAGLMSAQFGHASPFFLIGALLLIGAVYLRYRQQKELKEASCPTSATPGKS